jgi:hypothetical protein
LITASDNLSSIENFAFRGPSRGRAAFKLAPPTGDGDDPAELLPFNPLPHEREDLPYSVELWDAAKLSVEQVLAVTANGSIGYAAYFGAIREYPTRYITLRHKHRILSSWNGPGH